jgi:hypothetical protein
MAKRSSGRGQGRQSFRGGLPPPAAPTRRRLRVYAFDPSLSTKLETWRTNQVTLSVPWEPLGVWEGRKKIPGPVGDYFEIVDVDPATGVSYDAVDLDDPSLLASDGLGASEIDPRFHQQMVYAVGMNTVTHFERALGRTAMWAPRWRIRDGKPVLEYTHRLRVYPHAMREANAYYSPERMALLFGYFRAIDDGSGEVMPGSTVYTCLSHDVIAHETTHALLDGLHPHFTDASNPDVLAFHEAFADIVAIFSRFSMPEVVKREVNASCGRLDTAQLLGSLAVQFGAAVGQRGALRQYIGKPADPSLIQRTFEPHDRGAILVAAVFDAFLAIYRNRTDDLMRISGNGRGTTPRDLHPDLVDRLAREAYTAARHVLTMCIRALDYCPPVDMTFGEYLRALITADSDMVPDDDKHYRVAVIDAFRRHGIFPVGVNSMSEEALRWERPQFSKALEECLAEALEAVERQELLGKGSDREARALSGSYKRPGALPAMLTPRGQSWAKMDRGCGMIRGFLLDRLGSSKDIQWQLGVAVGRGAPGSIPASDADGRPSFRVDRLRHARRVGPGGLEVTDYVLEITQQRDGYLDPKGQARADKKAPAARRRRECDFVMRGGCTLNIDMKSRRVRYCVAKNIISDRRLALQREYLGGESTTLGVYSRARLKEPFAMLHRC